MDAKVAKKISHILFKNVLFEFIFRDEGPFYVNYLFYIIIIYFKCLVFEFLRCGIHMHILTLTKKMRYRLKSSHVLLKNILLKINFQVEVTFKSIVCFIFSHFALNCLLFKFFSRVMRMHITILTGVQKGYIGG